jgi:uncharacterized protein YlaI
MYEGFDFRELKRKAFCRVCDTELESGEKVFHTYSWRNRGHHIYICMGCMNEIVEEMSRA